MKWIRVVLSLLLAAALFWALDNRHGMVPAFGKLVNPFAGFWRNGEGADRLPAELSLPGLQAEVKIVWDSRCVPHIFAANSHDLYFAQGYVCASLRLWQMDFQVLYAGGRLAEVVGPTALPLDRSSRRFGMTWAAERAADEMRQDPETRAAAEAYTAGVNAYISTLRRKDYPVEYKILDYAPEPWTEDKSALLLKYMAYMLSGYTADASLTRLRDALGEAAAEALFPLHPPLIDPVIPPGTPLDFKPVAVPEVPSSSATEPPRPGTGGTPGPLLPDFDERSLGSNNWAVSGALTKSGFPILCNDMHLALSLPMIWYEVQLAAPGINIYGVSIPGAPTVIVGFSQRIAWGFTNGTDDVLDLFAVKFKDDTRREYLDGGQWKAATIREEVIKVRGRPDVVERVVTTHLGPVFQLKGEAPLPDADFPADTAVRWMGHEPSNEFKTLVLLNRARDYDDYLRALSYWNCPSQNFAYADAGRNIALWHNGRFPLRWKGQGRYVLDGADPGQAWQGWIPRDQIPHVKNPARGFVSSANQPAVDAGYPYYLGSDYGSFERGARINEILAASKDITADDMIRMQGDVLNIRARTVLPRLLEILNDAVLPGTEQRALKELQGWNFECRANLAAPSVFDRFWQELYALTWNDEKRGDMKWMNWPQSQVMIGFILAAPDSEYFDDKATSEKETRAVIVRKAFAAACAKLEKDFGPPGASWDWGKVKGTRFDHLGRIPGLGRDAFETEGVGIAINAIGRSWGPSWRMVVEMGPEVRAWGIYPGGQSGNPGSKYYDNFIPDWAAGKPYELVFLTSADEIHPAVAGRTVMRGAK